MVTRLPTARKFGNRPKPIGTKVPNKKDVNFTDDEMKQRLKAKYKSVVVQF